MNSDGIDGYGKICVMNSDGSGLTELTPNRAGGSPATSPQMSFLRGDDERAYSPECVE